MVLLISHPILLRDISSWYKIPNTCPIVHGHYSQMFTKPRGTFSETKIKEWIPPAAAAQVVDRICSYRITEIECSLMFGMHLLEGILGKRRRNNSKRKHRYYILWLFGNGLFIIVEYFQTTKFHWIWGCTVRNAKGGFGCLKKGILICLKTSFDNSTNTSPTN